MLIIKSTKSLLVYSLEIIKTFVSIVFIGVGFLISYSSMNQANPQLGGVGVGVIFAIGGLLLANDIGFKKIRFTPYSDTKVFESRGFKTNNIAFPTTAIQKIQKLEYVGIGNGSTAPNDILRIKVLKHGWITIAETRQNTLFAKILRPYRMRGRKLAKYLNMELEIESVNLLRKYIDTFKK